MNTYVKKIFKKSLVILIPAFWFLVGFIFTSITITSLILVYFHSAYQNKAIPGISVGNIYVGDKTQTQIQHIFDQKNEIIDKGSVVFSYYTYLATGSAQSLNIGYNSNLLATQAVSLGKSGDIFSDLYTIVHSYLNGINLPFSYTIDKSAVTTLLNPIQKNIYIAPVDAQFQMENGRVTTFERSSAGRTVDFGQAQDMVQNKAHELINSNHPVTVSLAVPVKKLKPNVSTEDANHLGIIEGLGEGDSTYFGSDPNRVANIALAASRVNGVLVAPGEVFSFDKAIGDVSSYTGYKQAYVIENGKTVLGDGGGVCQVSTTLFRAILNAGLPVVERHAHAYRVGYYEQNSPPGIDATIYVPTVDLKFKNDTNHYILIQSVINTDDYSLAFVLYGTKDGRQVQMTTPVVTNQTPAPAPLYQDDPSLPEGTIKQVDFAAAGATVTFSRTVTRNNKVIIADTYTSNYQPWQAVYLKGTAQ